MHHRRLCAADSLPRRSSRSLPNQPLIPEDELHHQQPAESHIAPSLSHLFSRLDKFPPAADAPETCAFAGSQAATKSSTSLHICSFPPFTFKVKRTRCSEGLSLYLHSRFLGERCYMANGVISLFPPRGAVLPAKTQYVLVITCVCLAPSRLSKSKVWRNI